MDIILLGGFLGSGKTTVLVQLANLLVRDTSCHRADDTPPAVAVIENEIGKSGIDNLMLRSRNYQVKNLFAGCVCCTLYGELVSSIQEIEKQINPRWLIIEATGVAYPGGIRKLIEDQLGYPVHLIVLADSSRWSMLVKAMPSLVEGQLEAASHILINKIDLASEDAISEVEASIQRLNPMVPIYKISAKDELGDGFWSGML